jgi:hypothetical protein
MTIDDWVAEQLAKRKAELDRFVEAWERKADTDPGNWPADMPPGEWDEMFQPAPAVADFGPLRRQNQHLILEIKVRDGIISDLQDRLAEFRGAGT